MSFLTEWSNWFTNNRFDWITKAKNDLCTHLEHPFTKQLVTSNTGKNVNLALFGKTQVGKTTLILKLMGIKTEFFEEIADLLRCGSDIGYSATPTAMVYRISKNNNFKIVQFNKNNCSIEESKDLEYQEIKEILKQIRHKVESNQYDNSSELIIEIPLDYFKIEEDRIDLNVIDLPGLNSRSCHEREWTKKLIKQFLPAANMVLVLDRGNQVTGFQDLFDDEELNNVTNWKYFPEKYRVITTYSYTAESVRMLFNNSDNFKPEELLSYYRDEIYHSLDNEECNDLIVYPLEYGESWETFCNENQNNLDLSKIKEVNQHFFEQLIQDISISSSELNQISLLMNIGTAFKRRKTEYEEELLKIQRICEEDISQINLNIANIQLLIEDHSTKISSINNVFFSLNNISFDDTGFNKYSGRKNRDEMYSYVNKIKNDINMHIDNFEKEIWRIIDDLKSKHSTILNDEINDLIQKGFTQIRDIAINKFDEVFYNTMLKLKSLIFSVGRWKVIGPDDSHIESLNLAISTLNECIKCAYNEVIKPNIGPIYDYLGTILYHQDLNRSRNESQKSEILHFSKQKHDEFNNKIRIISNDISQINADIARASLVSESIKIAKDYHINECWKALFRSKGSRTILFFLQAVQIQKDYMSAITINRRNNE